MWPREGLLRVPDGRVLGYAEAGDPGGEVCFYFHGNPASRLQALAFHSVAAHHGIRIVGPDRPGYGVSSFQLGRRFADWPSDLIALADHLGAERFAVLGVSGGCAYVWACAALVPDRVVVAVSVSGHVPRDVPGALEGVSRGERVGLAVARRLPRASRLVFEWRARGRRRRLRAELSNDQSWAVSEGRIDRRFLRADRLEAYRQGGRGQWWETVLYGSDWGFSVEGVSVPVHLWHGDADRAASPVGARNLAARVPNCTLHLVQDAGHELVTTRTHEILDVVSAAFRGA